MPGKILITGGAGFIGSALIRQLIHGSDREIANLDKLTYAANPAALACVADSPRYRLHAVDVCDGSALARIFAEFRPDAVIHLAAESHVDRSIDAPAPFVQTNLVGTFTLLEAARRYRDGLPAAAADAFRFLQVSTDEVYGDLGDGMAAFRETTPYAPSSPYSASKAGADHLVRAWQRTYGLPVLVSHCSNNYGPWQVREKLIPLMIDRALRGQPLPVYGDGAQVRDWLYVDDHVRALLAILERGRPGESYNVGAHAERRNLDVVGQLCDLLDELKPRPHGSYRQQIAFVADRPGHDRRYAIDAGKIAAELGWRPLESFASGLRKTVQWYLEQPR